MGPRSVKLTREELYDAVWAEPMVKVAARFGLSDVGLKKICKRHGIPVPGRGYWRKLQTGKRVRKVPLPPTASTHPISITVYERLDRAMSQEEEPEAVARQIVFEQLPANRITVPDTLEKPHRLTRATRRELRSKKDDEYGVRRCNTPELFYLRTARSSMDRALRIMDALFQAFDARGFEVKGSTYERGHACVLVNDEAIGFSIEERVRRQTHTLTKDEQRRRSQGQLYWMPSYDYIATEKLSLKLDTGYGSGLRGLWSDTNRQKLEDCLNDVIVGMVRLAEHQRLERLRREEEQRRRDAENARRAELHRRQEAEAEAVARLYPEAKQWHKAERIRAYVAAVEDKARKDGKAIDAESELGRWLKWARDQAARVDPLEENPPSILDQELPRLLY